ncbi:helicase [Streptomyces sp. NBC_01431]|nr:helicase [Streptomyces sp. NBC_01431]
MRVAHHQDHDVRLGVWISNQKMRRDRLTEQQLAQRARLGLDRV